MAFKKLGLHESIADLIHGKGITKPTKIQELAIPEIINGRDVLAGSATGSGKTIAFGSGVVHNLEDTKDLAALVLAPTREIAEQVKDVLKSLSDTLKTIAVYGGVAIGPQIQDLETANIVVGTPGRILDHMQRQTVDFSKIQMLVLDEADKMFEMGFIEDIQKIIQACPKEKQTLLFSATYSKEIEQVTQRYMKKPAKIQGVKQVDPEKLKQVYYNVPVNLKFSLLGHLLLEEKGKALIFANTKHMVDALVKSINTNNMTANGIHGGMTQAKRNQSLDEFKSDKVNVLVCTDVAARGLDIPDVSHVYNYDIPIDSKDYIHRIGRTARAGKEGEVRNILARNDFDNFSRIMRDYPRLKLDLAETPSVKQIPMARIERRNNFKGGQRSGSRQGFNRGPRR